MRGERGNKLGAGEWGNAVFLFRVCMQPFRSQAAVSVSHIRSAMAETAVLRIREDRSHGDGDREAQMKLTCKSKVDQPAVPDSAHAFFRDLPGFHVPTAGLAFEDPVPDSTSSSD